MTCKGNKHHRKRHPMSEGERKHWGMARALNRIAEDRLWPCVFVVWAMRFGKKRRERDALRDAGRNPYKRGDKK